MKNLLLLFLITTVIYADNNQSSIDQYHDNLCEILVSTSNSIDNYFIEESNSSIGSSTHAEFSSSVAMENSQAFEKSVRLRLRLSLPKIQKNLSLVFEDENNDNSLYDRTTLNEEKLVDKSYYLRLEYFKFIKKKFNLVAGAGLRIRHGNLVPYLNLRSRFDLYKEKPIKSSLYNRLRFYSDGEIEDIFEFNTHYKFDESAYAIFRNQLTLSNLDNIETLYHDISLVKELNKKKQLSVGGGVRSVLKNFKDYSVEYCHLHTLYHHLFYKNWGYYQVAPSVLWRESNQFRTSYRLMLNFGILFKKG
jgi:hypothetical protein